MGNARPEVHVPITSASGSGPPPPGSLDRFAPKYLVGNVPAGDSNVAYNSDGFMYIPDAGNCAGIQTALTMPNGLGDVYVRPGSFTNLTGAALVVPSGCRVWGAGVALTTIASSAAAGASQEVFLLNQGASLLNIAITSAAQAAPGAGASKAVVRTGGSGVQIKDCAFSVLGATRTQPWMVWDASGTIEVYDSSFVGVDSSNDNPNGPCIGIVIGPDPATTPNTYIPLGSYEVSRCQFSNANRAISVYNVGAGHVADCAMDNMQRSSFGVIGMVFGGTVVQPQPTITATIVDVRMYVGPTEAIGDTTYTGVTLQNFMDGLDLVAFDWSSIRVLFFPAQNPSVVRNAFRVLANSLTNGDVHIGGGSIVGCFALGHTRGLFIDAIGVAAKPQSTVSDIRVSACTFAGPDGVGATPGVGIFLQTVSTGLVDGIGISNCNCKDAHNGGFGIRIADVNCTNTIVLGNSLKPSGGTAIDDSGTDSEVAHNILA